MWQVSAQFQAHDLPKDTRWSVQVMDDGRAVAQSEGARVLVRYADWIAAGWVEEQ